MTAAYRNRHECKFVVDEGTAARIRRRVAPFVRPDEHARASADNSYPIASLYLDDGQFTLYRETLGGLSQRYKLRVRTYDDASDSPVFLEVKRRHDRVVQKLRVPVRREFVPTLLAGRRDTAALVRAADSAGLDEFLSLVQLRAAAPTVVVRYTREAYVGCDDGEVRVTFDRRLSAYHERRPDVRMHHAAYRAAPASGVIVELKFTDLCPAWMHDVIASCELSRRSFTKYGHCLQALRGVPLHTAD